MQLDAAGAEVERPGGLLDRLLVEVEADEGDQQAAGTRGRGESPVVGRPEGRVPVRLVHAEAEGPGDPVAAEERDEVVVGSDEAVDVLTDVDVDVEDDGPGREKPKQLLVEDGDEGVRALEQVLHGPRRYRPTDRIGSEMADVLMFADTLRSPELRHEIPVPIPDPFVYVERDGSRRVFVGSLEVPRLLELAELEATPLEELGVDELLASGLSQEQVSLELLVRACRHSELLDAVTPRGFPLEAADYLRANGIAVRADGELFDRRRRVKTEVELDGIRRAQRAAERAMDAIRALIRVGGELSSERLRAVALQAFSEAGVICPDIVIVSHGAQAAVGHEPGFGAIGAGEPIVVDLFPRDPDSGCYADMTRTFCVGTPPDELARFHDLCRRVLERVYASVRPGVRGSELHRIACELFQEHGFATQLTKAPGEVLEDGFFHSLGHGVGLEVHERPGLGRSGEELIAGDVLAVEPGLYRKGFGGCRLEDLVVVTEDGCEVLTDYPYELEP